MSVLGLFFGFMSNYSVLAPFLANQNYIENAMNVFNVATVAYMLDSFCKIVQMFSRYYLIGIGVVLYITGTNGILKTNSSQTNFWVDIVMFVLMGISGVFYIPELSLAIFNMFYWLFNMNNGIAKIRINTYPNLLFNPDEPQTFSWIISVLTMPKFNSIMGDLLIMVAMGFSNTWYIIGYLVLQMIPVLFFELCVYPYYPEYDMPFIDWGKDLGLYEINDPYLGQKIIFTDKK